MDSERHPERSPGRDLTTGSIPRHLVAFSLPMLAGSVLQTAYAFINAIWVGKFLGTTALAAVTVSFPVIFVLIAMGAGLTVATNILIAQHVGGRRYDQVRKVVDSSTLMVGGLSLLLTVVGELATPMLLRAMDTPADVLPMAVSYMRIYLLSLPCGFGLFLARNMLQGMGDSTTPLYFQSSAVLLGAILDPILMFGWLGFPRLGLNGTAWATVLVQLGAVVALQIYLQKKRNPVSPNWGHLRMDWETAWTTIRIGVPSAVQQSLISIGMVFVTGIVNSFGETATAAFGAVSRIDQLALMPAMTFSLAISTVAGQNIGANQYHRIREVLGWGCSLNAGVTLIGTVLALSVPDALLRIFIDDPTVISLGVPYLRVVGATYTIFALMFVTNGIINGAGHTMATTVISLIGLWMVRVPVSYWFAHRMDSVVGVWYGIAASFVAATLASALYFATGRWKRPIARRSRAPVASPLLGDEPGEA